MASHIKQKEEMNTELVQEDFIERLEALIQPTTNWLDKIYYHCQNPQHYLNLTTKRDQYKIDFEKRTQEYNRQIKEDPYRTSRYCKPRMHAELEKEELYVTLLSIIKNQDERIKKLEAILHK